MLQFFKKSGRNESHEEKVPDDNKEYQFMPSSSSSSSPPFDIILDEKLVNEKEYNESRSRLSMNLSEIISDKNCICYFVQFLETKNALSLIKFYLDAENFKTVTEISLCLKSKENIGLNVVNVNNFDIHRNTLIEGYEDLYFNPSDNCDSKKKLSSQSENSLKDLSKKKSSKDANNEDHDDESRCDVPELKNLCDLSMRKPLTDDEKSRIFAESNKMNKKIERITSKSNEGSNQSSKLSTCVATDAVRIYKKYLTLNSQYFIDIPATISSNISLALCAQDVTNDTSTSISSDCFEEAKCYVFERMEKEYLNDFLESSYYCKYCLDILTSSTLRLSDILHNESALFYFMEYLEQEHHQNYLEFWMAATNFRKHYQCNIDDSNRKEARSDAMILYEKYFSLQATCGLKVSDAVRSQIEENICSDNGAIIGKCFDLPLRIIENHIELHYFKNFQSSQLFSNYLNELKTKLKDDNVLKRKSSPKKSGHRKTMSDCTNENTKSLRNSFISQHNTLLAMESSKPKSGKTAADMQIETRHLTNPDLLWHRNSTGGLTFGRINALGRYERDFEMETTEEKWSLATGGHKIRNAVRKLVNLPEDKVQEEIAWQVAELIVKDITSITLGNNKNSENSG